MSSIRFFASLLTSPRLLQSFSSRSGAHFWGARNLFRFMNLPSDYPLFFMSFGPLALYAQIGRHSQMMNVLPSVTSEGLRQCELPRCQFARDTKYVCCLARSACECGFLSRISGQRSPLLHTRYLIRNLTCIAALSCRLSGSPGTQLSATIRCYFTSVLGFLAAGEMRIPRRQKYPERSLAMTLSRGRLRFEPLFTAEELGLREHSNIDHVVKVFLKIGDAVAMRRIEMPRCVLLLQCVANIAASGAIYLYDRERKVFYLAVFEHGRDDTLTTGEFELLVEEYELLRYGENLQRLAKLSQIGNA